MSIEEREQYTSVDAPVVDVEPIHRQRSLTSHLCAAVLGGTMLQSCIPVPVPVVPTPIIVIERPDCVQPPHSGSSGFPATCPGQGAYIPNEPGPSGNPIVDGISDIGAKTGQATKDGLAKGKEKIDEFGDKIKVDIVPARTVGDTLYAEEFPISVDFTAHIVDTQHIPADATILWQVYEVDRDWLVLRREGPLLYEQTGGTLHYVFRDRKEYKIKAIASGTADGQEVVYSTAKFIFPS